MTTTICGKTEGTLCDVCNRCSVCDRKLNATPHVYVCACPEPHPIDLCPVCRSKETAYQLTRTREDANRPHFWSDPESETP